MFKITKDIILLRLLRSLTKCIKTHSKKFLLLLIILLIYKNPLFIGTPIYILKVSSGSEPSIPVPSVLLKCRGGLGNQLFQYACAYSLARKHNWPLYVYSPFFGTTGEGPRRMFNLKYFRINATILNYLHPFLGAVSIEEKEILENTYPHNETIALHGYCQSDVFFSSYKEEIISQFTLKIPLDPIQDKIDLIKRSSPSVAVHIRRGDFYNNRSRGRALRISHFTQSMERITKELKTEPTFFVFSDDIPFCKIHLKNFTKVHFISERRILSGLRSTEHLEDFYLMQICEHQIIGTSTYGWWGAYLNKNPHKIVIAAELSKFIKETKALSLIKTFFYPLGFKAVTASYYD